MNECIFSIDKIKEEFRKLGGNIYSDILSPDTVLNIPHKYVHAKTYRLAEILEEEFLKGIVKGDMIKLLYKDEKEFAEIYLKKEIL